MNPHDSHHPKRQSGGRTLLWIVAGLLVVILVAYAIISVRSLTQPATRLVYQVNHNGLTAEDFVEPLTRRLDMFPSVRVGVIGPQQISVDIATDSAAEVAAIKNLVQSSGVLRFLVVANRNDHSALIQWATTPVEQDTEATKDRNILDGNGVIIGRWVHVARESGPAKPGQPMPFRANPTKFVIRDAKTHAMIELPPDAVEDSSFALDQWLESQSINEIDALMAVDELTETRGEDLKFASSTFDQNGNPSLTFILNDEGSHKFFHLTTTNSPVGQHKRQLGIVLDDELLTAPNILSPIRNEGCITGNFTNEEVDHMVHVLKSGQLPGPLSNPISETKIEVPRFRSLQ